MSEFYQIKPCGGISVSRLCDTCSPTACDIGLNCTSFKASPVLTLSSSPGGALNYSRKSQTLLVPQQSWGVSHWTIRHLAPMPPLLIPRASSHRACWSSSWSTSLPTDFRFIGRRSCSIGSGLKSQVDHVRRRMSEIYFVVYR